MEEKGPNQLHSSIIKQPKKVQIRASSERRQIITGFSGLEQIFEDDEMEEVEIEKKMKSEDLYCTCLFDCAFVANVKCVCLIEKITKLSLPYTQIYHIHFLITLNQSISD
uniref:Uncharacterized protein n=1 Tax=Onchocerca flexuosa TaxID=387005 RepID=A0A183HH47_9BILA